MTLVVFVALYVLVYIECLVRRWLSAAALLTWACLVTLGYVLVFDSWTNAVCAWEQVTPVCPGAGCRQPAAPSLGIRPPWGRGLHVVCGARLLPMPWPWVCDSGRPQSAFGGRRFLRAEGGRDWLRGLRIRDSGCGRPWGDERLRACHSSAWWGGRGQGKSRAPSRAPPPSPPAALLPVRGLRGVHAPALQHAGGRGRGRRLQRLPPAGAGHPDGRLLQAQHPDGAAGEGCVAVAQASGRGCGVAEGSQVRGAEFVPRRRSSVCRRTAPRTGFPVKLEPWAGSRWPLRSRPSVPQRLGPSPRPEASRTEPRPQGWGRAWHSVSRLSVEWVRFILSADRGVHSS